MNCVRNGALSRKLSGVVAERNGNSERQTHLAGAALDPADSLRF